MKYLMRRLVLCLLIVIFPYNRSTYSQKECLGSRMWLSFVKIELKITRQISLSEVISYRCVGSIIQNINAGL